MKQLFRNIALLFLSAFLLTACNLASHRRVQAVLDDVESYINDRPDSALAVLRALPQDDVRGREQRARTALLHSIALDKCAIDLRTDSIIEPAVLFYSRHGAQNNRMKTAYYLGRSRSLVSGAFEITGPSYVYSNVEYTYTIERVDSYADNPPHVSLQILDPNTSATLIKVGEVTYKFICNSMGAYYIRVTGTHNGVEYSFDSYPIICLY